MCAAGTLKARLAAHVRDELGPGARTPTFLEPERICYSPEALKNINGWVKEACCNSLDPSVMLTLETKNSRFLDLMPDKLIAGNPVPLIGAGRGHEEDTWPTWAYLVAEREKAPRAGSIALTAVEVVRCAY
ncbi:hypothetical protein NDU88_008496 [Pleurodeles waltl]|uniref:Uncharacterized protein n=1 Tax=Pleurodeles waltl TaxID=8319 RepID=A0AAV7RVM4_PLEWA|nr:hypothetical protein NDU88_008496 [Pleurodeles waltl]